MSSLLFIKFGIDASLFILIWLVQVIIYPSFKYADPKQFDDWHRRYMQLITYFVAPLMLTQVGTLSWLLYNDFNWIYVITSILVGLVWLSTAVFSVPCHTRLSAEIYNLNTIKQLIQTNWYRTILWTIVLILNFVNF